MARRYSMTPEGRTALIARVREYALAHYGVDGWDYVIESAAFEDEPMLEIIGRASTVKGALMKVSEVARLFADVRDDVRAAGGLGPMSGPAPESSVSDSELRSYVVRVLDSIRHDLPDGDCDSCDVADFALTYAHFSRELEKLIENDGERIVGDRIEKLFPNGVSL